MDMMDFRVDLRLGAVQTECPCPGTRYKAVHTCSQTLITLPNPVTVPRYYLLR